MLCRAVLVFCVVITGRWLPAGEAVRLKATADVWLSDAIPQERNTSSGKCSRLKLKTMNISVDKLTPLQKKYLKSWEMGT